MMNIYFRSTVSVPAAYPVGVSRIKILRYFKIFAMLEILQGQNITPNRCLLQAFFYQFNLSFKFSRYCVQAPEQPP